MINQRIVVDYPPNFDELDKRFGIGNSSVLFSWGTTLFNPQDAAIRPELIYHEAAHGDRQIGDIVGWWRHYIDDPKFRLAEEIVAHRIEYLWLRQKANRQQRRAAAKRLARRLSGPLYGNLTSFSKARQLITEEVRYDHERT